MPIGSIIRGFGAILAIAGICCLSASAEQLSDAEEFGAVYNEKVWQCRVEGNTLVQNYSARLTVLNKKGEEHNRLSFLETDFYEIKELKARLIDSSGKMVFERDKDDFTKVCGYDGVSTYSDHCYYYTTLSSPHYPYTLEWEYTKEYKTLFFWPNATLQSSVPVTNAIYKLTVPADLDFRYRTYSSDLEPVILESDDSKISYTWKTTNLPALEEVDYMPPGERLPAMIRFAACGYDFEDYSFDKCDWQSIGQWYKHLARDRYCQFRLIKGLALSSGEPHNILQAVYDYVTENVRYVAIQIGIGGWQPYHSQTTMERGFGDCKDMSTLLVSELRNLGIQAFPALVLTRSNGKVDLDFPASYFNHVIAVAVVGDDTVWMDPTCDECRYDELPTGDQDIPALVMTAQGGELWRTPASAAVDNHTVRTTHWHIRKDLHADISSVMEVTGNYARYVRGIIPTLDKDQTRQFINDRFRGADRKFEILSYDIRNLDSLHLPVEISIKAESRKPSRVIRSALYFDPFVMTGLSSLEQTNLSDRKYPLNLYYPFSRDDHINITWDPALSVDSVAVPNEDSVGFECADFKLHFSTDSSAVAVDIRKAHHTYQVDVEQLEAFADFRDKMKKSLSQHVKLYLR